MAELGGLLYDHKSKKETRTAWHLAESVWENVRKPLLPISMTVRDVAELGSLFYGRESEKERADGMTSCRSCLGKRPQGVAVCIHARERYATLGGTFQPSERKKGCGQ